MKWPELDPKSLEKRSNLDFGTRRYLRMVLPGIRSTGALVVRFPESLLPGGRVDEWTTAKPWPAVRSFALGEDRSNELLRAAKNAGVTGNDLFLAKLFQAVGEFRDRYAPPSHRPLRIAMPVNVRSEFHRNLFATNVVSMVFLDRSRSQIREDRLFLDGIHRETDWIKKRDQAFSLLMNLRGRRFLPGGIRAELTFPRCWATTVLSNLGKVFAHVPLPRTEKGEIRLGDAVLEAFIGTPPLRRRTLSAWSVCYYAGRLWFALRADDRLMTPEQTDDHVEFYRKRLEQIS